MGSSSRPSAPARRDAPNGSARRGRIGASFGYEMLVDNCPTRDGQSAGTSPSSGARVSDLKQWNAKFTNSYRTESAGPKSNAQPPQVGEHVSFLLNNGDFAV